MSQSVPVVLYKNAERIPVGEAVVDNGKLVSIVVTDKVAFDVVPEEITLVQMAPIPENADLMTPPPRPENLTHPDDPVDLTHE